MKARENRRVVAHEMLVERAQEQHHLEEEECIPMAVDDSSVVAAGAVESQDAETTKGDDCAENKASARLLDEDSPGEGRDLFDLVAEVVVGLDLPDAENVVVCGLLG